MKREAGAKGKIQIYMVQERTHARTSRGSEPEKCNCKQP